MIPQYSHSATIGLTGLGTVLLASVVFLTIRCWGQQLVPGAAAATAAPAEAPSGGSFFSLLVAATTIMLAARATAGLFRLVGQPPVVGEILAGVLVGPSVLGRFAPSCSAFLFAPGTVSRLGALAQFGIVLYMFFVGLKLDATLLRGRAHAVVLVSHASIAIPFSLGVVLSLLVYPRLAPSNVAFAPFALFMGISISVTAFPVLARILVDRGLDRTPLGVVALACGAVDDVTAWCLLAVVVSVARAEPGRAWISAVGAVGYIVVMLLLLRPVLPWIGGVLRLNRAGDGAGLPAFALVGTLCSALVTEALGLHAVFGAFVFGLIMPDKKGVIQRISGIEDFLCLLLLPMFFAFTGLRTNIQYVSDGQQWLYGGVIILTATLGKFGGGAAAARAVGFEWSEAAALGVLMNTRGLMELVVVNIGLDLKIISPALFAILTVMALVTTVATTPLLTLLGRGRAWSTGVLVRVAPVKVVVSSGGT
jgi:Kef-type K+ transport system membrane component KefB